MGAAKAKLTAFYKSSILKRFMRRRKSLFRLLDLPAELQLIVYEYVVCYPGPIHISRDPEEMLGRLSDKCSGQLQFYHDSPPPLTRVNRYLRELTMVMYYSSNRFVAYLWCSRGIDWRTARIVRCLRQAGMEGRGWMGELVVYDRGRINIRGGPHVPDYRMCVQLLRLEFKLMGGTLTRDFPDADEFRVTFP